MKNIHLAVAALLAASAPLTGAWASSVLIINGNSSSTVAAPISASGFTVISESFRPGAISDHLSVTNDISQIWVWNDGTFGNSFSASDPSRAFSAADETALKGFNAAHGGWIMDGLSWRGNQNMDEKNFTMNEVLALQGAGGGIVLGADDGSGAAIVQHVNQVASLFGFDLFEGVYNTSASSQLFGGSLISTPYLVNPTGVFGTQTYSEVPNGQQPNGIYLSTVMFGQGTPNYCCSSGFGALDSATFNGVTYANVNHVVTTSIAGGGIDPDPTPPVPPVGGVPEPASWAMLLLGFGMIGSAVRRTHRQQAATF